MAPITFMIQFSALNHMRACDLRLELPLDEDAREHFKATGECWLCFECGSTKLLDDLGARDVDLDPESQAWLDGYRFGYAAGKKRRSRRKRKKKN